MATLQQIGTNGFAGLVPTPVMQHAINNYMVNDKLMNLVEFVNIGMGTNIGNIQATYVYYDDVADASFRGLGEEYGEDNATPKTGTVTLKALGGAFKTDKMIERAIGANANAQSVWTEQQIANKINGINNGFSKYFIKGNAGTNAKEFDGLSVFFTKNVDQVDAVPYLLNTWSEAKALEAEEHINKTINKVRNGKPNVVITTTAGKSKLQTLNAYRHRGVEAIEVNGQKYDQYMGMAIVDLPDTYFEVADTTDKIPLIFVYFNEVNGARVAVPMDGVVVDITAPEFGAGTLVKTGAVEMLCAPILADKYCASKCYLTETGV